MNRNTTHLINPLPPTKGYGTKENLLLNRIIRKICLLLGQQPLNYTPERENF
jgi:hypothetical protein